jgi:hypothetical protein
MHKFLWSIIGISVTAVLSLYLAQSELQFVNAQTGNLSKVIEEKFSKQIGTGTSPLIELFVHVIYESPNTIVLQGDLITESSTTTTTGLINTDLWAAMDLLKNQYGFKILQVMTSGVGSVGNPTTVYILMTK